MTWAELGALFERFMQWVRENPWVAAGIFLGLTVLRTPLQEGIDALFRLVTEPIRLVSERFDLVARRMIKWSAVSTTAAIAGFFRPVVSEPQGFVAAVNDHVRDGIGGVRSWPVAALAAGTSSFLRAIVVPSREALRTAAATTGGNFTGALSALRGGSGQWVGWRVIGAFLFTVALAGFIYADIGLLLPTFAKLLNVPDDSPTWLHNLALQFGAASFLSFAMMGIVLLDFIGVTHFGPWTELRGPKRIVLVVVVLVLFAFLFMVSAFLSAWRANEVLVPVAIQDAPPTTWLSAERGRELAGWALTLLPPLMLVATALIGWGLAAMPLVAWLLFVGGLTLFLRFIGVVLAICVGLLDGPLEVAVRGSVRFTAGATEVALRGISLVLQAMGQVMSLVGLVGRTILSAFVHAALGFWLAVRGVLHLLSLGLSVVVRGLRAAAELLKAVVRLVTHAGWVTWNWITGFDWARRTAHLQPIQDRAALEPETPLPAAGL